jgi:GNAT superfamily N-acetyltransferase
MLIRSITRSDLPAARVLLRQLGYDIALAELAARLDRVGAAVDHCVAVAELDGQIAGLLHVFERPALEKPCEAIVQALVVEVACRGKGVGRALMRHAETWARTRGLASIALHTRIDRDDACAFYARIGYDAAATSHRMRKQL